MTESSLAITIVGAGNVGVHLARAVARLGHAVTFAVRDPDSPRVQRALAEVPDATVVTLAGADPRADLTVLAVPAAAIPAVPRPVPASTA